MAEIFLTAPFLALALFIRFSIAFWMLPLLGRGPLPLPVIGVLSALVTFFVIPDLPIAGLTDLSETAVPAVLLNEVAAGVLLGTAVRFCWMVLSLFGGLANQYALSNAQPTHSEHYGKLFFFLGTASFFLLGGHHSLFLAAIRSLEAIPPLGAHAFQLVDAGHWPRMLNIFTTAFQFGVLVAAPIIVAALFVELLLAVGARLWMVDRSPMFSSIRTYLVQIAVILFLWKSIALLAQSMGQQLESVWG